MPTKDKVYRWARIESDVVLSVIEDSKPHKKLRRLTDKESDVERGWFLENDMLVAPRKMILGVVDGETITKVVGSMYPLNGFIEIPKDAKVGDRITDGQLKRSERKILAVIENGKVTNRIVALGDIDGCVEIPKGLQVDIGWDHDGVKFTNPNPDEVEPAPQLKD